MENRAGVREDYNITMVQFSRTQSSQIAQEVKKLVKNSKVAKVREVYEHTDPDDNNNFILDVEIVGEGQRLSAIPYISRSSKEISVPTVGDKVVVEWRGGEKPVPIARQSFNTNRDRPPVGRAGMWRKQAGPGSDIYTESYNVYDGNPATDDPRDLDIEKSYARFACKDGASNATESNASELSAAIEVYRDEVNDYCSSRMVGEGDSGLEFDGSDGSFELRDGNDYGIVSDGDGNFTWENQSIEFDEALQGVGGGDVESTGWVIDSVDLLDVVELGGECSHCRYHDGHVYLYDYTNFLILVYDVSDPSNVTKVNEFTFQADTNFTYEPAWAGMTFPSNDKMYLHGDALLVVDISDPSNVSEIGRAMIDAWNPAALLDNGLIIEPGYYDYRILEPDDPDDPSTWNTYLYEDTGISSNDSVTAIGNTAYPSGNGWGTNTSTIGTHITGITADNSPTGDPIGVVGGKTGVPFEARMSMPRFSDFDDGILYHVNGNVDDTPNSKLLVSEVSAIRGAGANSSKVIIGDDKAGIIIHREPEETKDGVSVDETDWIEIYGNEVHFSQTE